MRRARPVLHHQASALARCANSSTFWLVPFHVSPCHPAPAAAHRLTFALVVNPGFNRFTNMLCSATDRLASEGAAVMAAVSEINRFALPAACPAPCSMSSHVLADACCFFRFLSGTHASSPASQNPFAPPQRPRPALGPCGELARRTSLRLSDTSLPLTRPASAMSTRSRLSSSATAR